MQCLNKFFSCASLVTAFLVMLFAGTKEVKASSDEPVVTVFLLDSISILTDEQRELIKFNEYTHGRIIQGIILEESNPDNFSVYQVDMVVSKRDPKTGAMRQEVVIDPEKYLSALEEISKYVDKHPQERVVINMSFGRYYNLAMDFISTDSDVAKSAEDVFVERLREEGFIMTEEDVKKEQEAEIKNIAPLLKAFGVTPDDEMLQSRIEERISGLKTIGGFADKENIAEWKDTLITQMKKEGGITEEELAERMREEKLIAKLRKKNVIMVAAAGNDDTDERLYPASYTGVISVAASDSRMKTGYSNYGRHVDIAARGNVEKRYMQLVQGLNAQIIEDVTLKMRGTSFAAPHVVALVVNILKLAKDKDVDPLYRMQQNAREVANQSFGYINVTKTLQSIDPYYVAGDSVGGGMGTGTIITILICAIIIIFLATGGLNIFSGGHKRHYSLPDDTEKDPESVAAYKPLAPRYSPPDRPRNRGYRPYSPTYRPPSPDVPNISQPPPPRSDFDPQKINYYLHGSLEASPELVLDSVKVEAPFNCPNGSPIPIGVIIEIMKDKITLELVLSRCEKEIVRLRSDLLLYDLNQVEKNLIECEVYVLCGYIAALESLHRSDFQTGEIIYRAKSAIILAEASMGLSGIVR